MSASAEMRTACSAREHTAGREMRGIRRQANTEIVPHVDGLRKYTTTQRRVIWWLLARLRRHGPSGEWRTHVSASQGIIAAQIGVDRRSVLRALARLQADGLVSRRHQPLPKGGRLADLIVGAIFADPGGAIRTWADRGLRDRLQPARSRSGSTTTSLALRRPPAAASPRDRKRTGCNRASRRPAHRLQPAIRRTRSRSRSPRPPARRRRNAIRARRSV